MGFTASSSGGGLERTLILKGGFLILKGGISKAHLMGVDCFLLLRACLSSVPAWRPGMCFCVVPVLFYGSFLYPGIPWILQLQKLACAGSFRVDRTALFPLGSELCLFV